MIVPTTRPYAAAQNPILAANPRPFGPGGYGEFAPATFSAPANPFAGMGEFVQGIYTAPQNPFAMRAQGMGCGCSIFPGMGQTETTLTPDPTAVVVDTSTLGTITTAIDQQMANLENWFSTGSSATTGGSSSILTWVAVGLGLYAIYWLVTPGGREYAGKRSSLEDQYRGYRRVGRSARAAGAAITPAGLTKKRR
jgi:hypothetical protein